MVSKYLRRVKMPSVFLCIVLFFLLVDTYLFMFIMLKFILEMES